MVLVKRLFFLAGAFWVISGRPVAAEWLSIEGQPAKWNDIINVRLADLHPTQPSIGYDRIYYKLGRYAKDHRKIFDEYCENNGQRGIRDFSFDPARSILQDPKSFACLEPVGTDLTQMKTVVIAPDGKLYLTDGHHTFNAFWHVKGGGPELRFNVIVARDYKDYPSMDEFWKQMRAEKNVWLLDAHEKEISVADLPKSFGLKNFVNDDYRSLMYFTKRIAWNSPGTITVPDPVSFDDRYPSVPFLEFYWEREVRKLVDLTTFDLTTRDGYVAAIRAVGKAIMNVRSTDIGESGKSAIELGQYSVFNERELFRINRPGTGKISYMLAFKNSKPAL